MATIKICLCPFCGADDVVTNDQSEDSRSSVRQWHMKKHTNPKTGKNCKRVWYEAPKTEDEGTHFFWSWAQISDENFKPSIFYAGTEVFLQHTGKHENQQMVYDQSRIDTARANGLKGCCIYQAGRSAYYEEDA